VHRLSHESRNLSRRTTRYTLRKLNNQTYLGSKQHSHGDDDDKTQPPLRINGTGNQTQIAQTRSTQDINRQCCQPHGQITVRSKIIHDDTLKTTSEFSELPYILLRFPSILSVSLIILSF